MQDHPVCNITVGCIEVVHGQRDACPVFLCREVIEIKDHTHVDGSGSCGILSQHMPSLVSQEERAAEAVERKVEKAGPSCWFLHSDYLTFQPNS